MNKETLEAIKRMCDIITNNTFGNDELDSLALHIGHHPDLLNPTSDNSEYIQCKHEYEEHNYRALLCSKCGHVELEY